MRPITTYAYMIDESVAGRDDLVGFISVEAPTPEEGKAMLVRAIKNEMGEDYEPSVLHVGTSVDPSQL